MAGFWCRLMVGSPEGREGRRLGMAPRAGGRRGKHTLTPTTWPFHSPLYTLPKDPLPTRDPSSSPSKGPVEGRQAKCLPGLAYLGPTQVGISWGVRAAGSWGGSETKGTKAAM